MFKCIPAIKAQSSVSLDPSEIILIRYLLMKHYIINAENGYGAGNRDFFSDFFDE